MLGLLCGLKSEALIADKIPGVLVGCSGARTDLAKNLVWQLIDKGATRLVSFGLGGALSPDLAAGELVLGAAVHSSHGGWEADGEWNEAFLRLCPQTLCASVWGSGHIVSSIAEKAAIHRKSNAALLDMESQIVAEAAAQAGVPFNVVRAVADTALMALPPAAQIPLREDGSVNLRGVFSSLVNHPSQLPALIHLGQNAGRAMRALQKAVAVMKEMENVREQGR